MSQPDYQRLAKEFTFWQTAYKKTPRDEAVQRGWFNILAVINGERKAK